MSAMKKKTAPATKKSSALESEKQLLSFGMEPEESTHHFLVNLGKTKGPQIYISEHFEYFEHPGRQKIEYEIGPDHPAMRVVLSRERWDRIADTVQFEFNHRLKRVGAKSSRFKQGYNTLPRLFGKELIVLCWAIEDADPGLIPAALKNWQGLKPEERWWLYTMTNAATGLALKHRNTGWRKALRYALTENPTGDGE